MGCLLLVYRNTVDFCVLSLYPVILLNVSVLVVCFANSLNRDSFSASFPNWNAFHFFPRLIDQDRTSSKMINNHGKSGDPYFVLDLRGKAFSLLLLSITLWVFHKCPLLYWESFLFIYTYIYEELIDFVRCSFWIKWDNIVVFFFPFTFL